MKQKIVFIFMLCMGIALLAGCGKEETPEGVDSSLFNKEAQEGTQDDKELTNTDGAFIQSDITPEGIKNATNISFSQNKDSEYLLSIFDKESNTPKSFTYQDGTWTEKNNELVVQFIEANAIIEATVLSDFSDNWWVFHIEESLVKGSRIASDGSALEIDLSRFDQASKIGRMQVSDLGIMSLRITSGEEAETIFIDTNTGELIQNKLPSIEGKLIGDGCMISDAYAGTNSLYNIQSGDVVSSYETSKYEKEYSQNEAGVYYAFDNRGIYTIVPDGYLEQVVIEDTGYAYASPNLVWMELLADNNKITTYMATCEYSDSLKVYEYTFEENASLSKKQNLEIWSFEDSNIVRDAIAIFSSEYPECSVDFKFGKSGEDTELSNEDIVKNLNTQLLAGETPDVLFLDGLSIDAFHKQGLLDEINIDLEQSLYYENIINSYSKDGKVYAYPTYFQVPVFVSSDTTSNIIEQNTLENIAKLYQNPEAIQNDWTDDLFKSFYYASFHKMFPDNRSVNEAAVKEFLMQTKSMIEAQNMDSKQKNFLGSGGSTSLDMLLPTPSLDKLAYFNIPNATGILTAHWRARELFTIQDNIEIIPLLDGSYINQLISSIPSDAKNKEGAENFISILLSSEEVQGNPLMGFPVQKEIGIDMIIQQETEDPEIINDYKFIEDFHAFNWDGMFEGLSNPCEKEYLIYDIIYTQAQGIYEGGINIDAATTQIVQRLTLLFAERN